MINLFIVLAIGCLSVVVGFSTTSTLKSRRDSHQVRMRVGIRPPSIPVIPPVGFWLLRGKVLNNIPSGGNNTSVLAAEQQASMIAEFRSEVLEIRNQSFSFLRIPLLLLPSFSFRRRWLQAVLVSGDSIKASLIEEWGIHILAESLFLTITATPILEASLGRVESIGQDILTCLICVTSLMQLISIFSNIICLCAASEIPEEVFQKWLMSNNRLSSVVLTGQLHTISTYLFLVTMVVWPFIQYDSMSMKLLCGLSGLIPAAAYLAGPYQKLSRDLFPVVHHQVYTEDPYLQAAVDRDMALFFDAKQQQQTNTQPLWQVDAATAQATEQNRNSLDRVEVAVDDISTSNEAMGPSHSDDGQAPPLTLDGFLQGLGLAGFLAAFEANQINDLDTIAFMSPKDFQELGLSISQRVRIQRAHAALEQSTRGATEEA